MDRKYKKLINIDKLNLIGRGNECDWAEEGESALVYDLFCKAVEAEVY